MSASPSSARSRPEGEIEALFERAALPSVPPTEFLTKPLDELELRQLHRGHDVFISATRGEAWGLGAFEAALTDNLVIMPEYGGPIDFLSYARWLRVSYELTPVLPELHTARSVNLGGVRLRTVAKAAPTGIDASHLWAEPSLMTMVEHLRHAPYVISTNRPAPHERLRLFAYDQVGPMFLNALKEG
jgi:hypothetical protein